MMRNPAVVARARRARHGLAEVRRSGVTGHSGTHGPIFYDATMARRQERLSKSRYQRRKASPKNIQINAPSARYGPNGNFADQTRFPIRSVANPTAEPSTEPAKML